MEQTLNADEKSIVDTFELLPSEEELDYDKEVLLAAIMRKGGTFEPLYTDPEYFYWDCSMWWKKWRRNFTKQAEALMIDYKPLENYRRNEVEHSDTVEAGQLAQATHNQEVMDDDTSRTYSSQEVMDDDTTSNKQLDHTYSDEADGRTTGSEVVDAETTGTKNSTTEDNLATTKSISGSETVDNDTTKNGTTSEIETKQNNGSYTTNLSVAGFNSASLEPKSGESNTHNDTDTTTKSGTSSETGTDDTTTTRTQSETGSDDRDIKYSETTGGTEDRNTTTQGTSHDEKSGSSKDIETGTGTDDRTTNLSGQEAGTDDRTTTANGTLNQSTNNDRDWDHTSEIWGNIGVTTSQKMLQEELEIRKWNLYDFMSDKFVDECCVRVY